MLNFFRHIDYALFYLINDKLSNSFFDMVLPWCREKYNWIPFYILLIVLLVYVFKKEIWKIFVAVALLILVTDQLSSSIIKPLFQRLRPCRNPELADHVHQLVNCGSGYSFVSSHAANHFGLAIFLIMVFGKRFRWLSVLLLCWAAIISFAQVYVGLHFPSDVTVGALIGILFGWTAGKMVASRINI